MNTKLTIRLNKSIIENAKFYAKNHSTSLSRMIELYLNSMTSQEVKEFEITPLVDSLSGVVKLPNDFDFKSEYLNYLNEKYK